MVLAAAQATAFSTQDAQMAIPNATVVQMAQEGATSVDGLAEFDKDSLQQLAGNLRRPGGRVPDPNPNAAAGATIPTPASTFGTKPQKRLLAATDLVKYYVTTGRPLAAADLQWESAMKNFEVQWKALEVKKDAGPPEAPKIARALPTTKCI